jgi:hypothetical protein
VDDDDDDDDGDEQEALVSSWKWGWIGKHAKENLGRILLRHDNSSTPAARRNNLQLMMIPKERGGEKKYDND